MILLSEVAEHIQGEIDSWPTGRSTDAAIRVDPATPDARIGNPDVLGEALMVPVGLLLASAEGHLDIGISGGSDAIRVSFRCAEQPIGPDTVDWPAVLLKFAAWTPRIDPREDGIDLILDLPVAVGTDPVDLAAMARETGLTRTDVKAVLRGFLADARRHLAVLEVGDDADGDARFRAAHSLKGAGKTRRAPEFTAEARSVEQLIRNGENLEPAVRRLRSAWNRIETWFEGQR